MDTENTERARYAGHADDRIDAGPFGRVPRPPSLRPPLSSLPKLDLLGLCLGVILLPSLLDQTIVSVPFSEAVDALRQAPHVASPRSPAWPKWTPPERPGSTLTPAPDALVVVVEPEEPESFSPLPPSESDDDAPVAVLSLDELTLESVTVDSTDFCGRASWGQQHFLAFGFPGPCDSPAPRVDIRCRCCVCRRGLKHDPACGAYRRHWMAFDFTTPCNCEDVRRERRDRLSKFYREQAEQSLDDVSLPARRYWSRPSEDFQPSAGEAFMAPKELP